MDSAEVTIAASGLLAAVVALFQSVRLGGRRGQGWRWRVLGLSVFGATYGFAAISFYSDTTPLHYALATCLGGAGGLGAAHFGRRIDRRFDERVAELRRDAAQRALDDARTTIVRNVDHAWPPRWQAWVGSALEAWDETSEAALLRSLAEASRPLEQGEWHSRMAKLGHEGAPTEPTHTTDDYTEEIRRTTPSNDDGSTNAIAAALDPAAFGHDLAETVSATVAAALAAVDRQTPRLSIWLSLGYVLALGSAIGGFGSWLLLSSTDDVAKGVGGALMGAAAAFILRDIHEIAKRS